MTTHAFLLLHLLIHPSFFLSSSFFSTLISIFSLSLPTDYSLLVVVFYSLVFTFLSLSLAFLIHLILIIQPVLPTSIQCVCIYWEMKVCEWNPHQVHSLYFCCCSIHCLSHRSLTSRQHQLTHSFHHSEWFTLCLLPFKLCALAMNFTLCVKNNIFVTKIPVFNSKPPHTLIFGFTPSSINQTPPE